MSEHTPHDARLAALEHWLERLHPRRELSLSPASEDASFRRYFRCRFDDGATLIAMDAPPAREDCRPYLAVQSVFQDAGAHVPEVHAVNEEDGFLLLSDLGSTTYLHVLNDENAHALYHDATEALLAIQRASRPGVLPEYDRERLLAEMELFPVWYLGRHLGVQLDDKQAQTLYSVFDALLDVNLSEPKVFVHRDFHSRNLMVTIPNPGVLDFQDAVYGPITYDLASLFKDAYIRWDEERVLDWLIRYWERARALSLPVNHDFAIFHRDFEWMGAQRHIKVLGIFARLWHRDGKDGYLKDMPLVLDYLRRTCERYRELLPLARLLDQIEGRKSEHGYTF